MNINPISYRFRGSILLGLAALCLLLPVPSVRADYGEVVRSDQPVAHWRFEKTDRAVPNAVGSPELKAAPLQMGNARQGARPKRYPAFADSNSAGHFRGGGARLVIPGKAESLKFRKGDTITLEAWVNPQSITEGQQVYIIGKGRTGNEGFAADNQNWGLRLRGQNGLCVASFLFRSEDNRRGVREDWHRWNSKAGFFPNTGWHHVVVTYTFGQPESIRGYIDGQPTTGTWDYGGATKEAPVVDDDEVWIGSSMGGSPNASFVGLIDEVAVYRKALSPQRVAAHFLVDASVAPTTPPTGAKLLTAKKLPADGVVVQIFENIADSRSWSFPVPAQPVEEHVLGISAFAFVGFPKKYDAKGLIVDRSWPHMVRISGKVTLPAGEQRLLLRSHNAARLFIDNKLVAQTRFTPRGGSGHGNVPDLPAAEHPDLRPLPVGHAEQSAAITIAGGEHVVRLEVVVGGKGLRPEVGELLVAIAPNDKKANYQILSPVSGSSFALTDENWTRFAWDQHRRLRQINRAARQAIAAKEAAYWQERHTWVAEQLRGKAVPQPPANDGRSAIDRFIIKRLADAQVNATPIIDDHAFVRRAYLDTVGVIPTPAEVASFVKDKRADKRARLIDRLLNDPRWADHWVAYWQDVLAENPGILKPKLNNTGPFRYYLYEAFLDNRPIDRIATELILMEGSKYQGGPAGFAMASQNDVPMAAKAHVIGTAFLGVEMKCARCHDAPFHPFKQEQLFSMAAMLRRAPQEVPKSSSVPTQAQDRRLSVEVTLKPGQKVAPDWPFDDLAHATVPGILARNPKDERQRLAAIVTSPQNDRFAQVVVNRLWKRYTGIGLVEPVDDWDGATPSHPELLQWLAHELATNGYDLKHVARLILTSDLYQRQTSGDASVVPSPKKRLFAGPARRRMSAEQLIDSMFVASGKRFRSEPLNMDLDGRRPIDTFLNLGQPRRAWEFASLSNERDRPALAMPIAQSLTDVLKTFGWRETRQDPITVRDQTPTVLQPLAVANSVVGHRVVTLSDDHALTDVVTDDRRLDELIRTAFLRYLSRQPSDREMAMFASLLSEGFDKRVVKAASGSTAKRKNHAVSWSNHLNAEATKIMLEMEQAARRGDPPTERLNGDWRQRYEDMLWALTNGPEFVFVP